MKLCLMERVFSDCLGITNPGYFVIIIEGGSLKSGEAVASHLALVLLYFSQASNRRKKYNLIYQVLQDRGRRDLRRVVVLVLSIYLQLSIPRLHPIFVFYSLP
ncbi:hypothetical protein VTL71DRAFT_1014 [Oculimacula yallundae]|uniref:Uncharacterized protein n=1 Tax=Oculimacula yallundae TaxID=86028 RepID=A0ABR4D2S8_9HELO